MTRMPCARTLSIMGFKSAASTNHDIECQC